ncbi:hypothetical protein CC80DRAFT_541318 [Byssothecium circinans]|uniref:WW domain-containing protein n=1 Tax=Byssothecium circinans TaxID=147558 RepID=A0A6A5UHX3_9PLEO|nr:hypothetical protein CC80DRAFT_541318 [Byssothecium circinans]
MGSSHPQDAPPSYETATGSSSTPTPGIQRVSTDGPASRTSRNGIPPEHRRSMEDETRPLPEGWVRQFDPIEHHQFFVDTRADPPRSIWTHPYDDPEYLSTLSPEERKQHGRMHTTMSLDDVAAESSDDEHPHRQPNLPPEPQAATTPNDPPPTGLHKLTRKMKDKLTATTHEQRQNHRRQREEQERKAYQTHLQARHAMIRALETGQPQFLCKDQQGRDVYIEPPGGPGGAYRAGPRGYGHGAYGYNPYSQGPYADPNARFVRPVGPYGRPYGYGYGGGMGLGAPLAAGVLGGALLGGVLF